MATKPNLSEHVSLLFEIYNRVPHSHKVTAQEIQLQISAIGLVRDIRTVQRNLEILVKHLGVEKDTRDRPYGYHRAAQPLKTFGPRESILLNLAESWLTSSFPAEYTSTINSVFTEIHNLKTRNALTNVNRRPPYAMVASNPILKRNYSASFNTVFEQLSYGITNQHIVNLIIAEGTLSIEPLCFWAQANAFVVVYQQSDKTYQHIDIETIQRASVSTFTFEISTEVGFIDYLQSLDSF